METVIRQSMFIRDTADNIFTALTNREDISCWWGLVNDDADGTTVWYGMDRQWAVPITAIEPGKLLAFAFDAHHPHDHDRVEPTHITFTITELGDASIVTVVQNTFSDSDWNELIHDGWVYTLLSLQSWVERGISFADLTNEKTHFTYKHGVAVSRDAEWAWRALTDPALMANWLAADVKSVPEPGGDISIVLDGGSQVDGEWTLLSQPRNLVCTWKHTELSRQAEAPGVITTQQWLILPAARGCVVTLQEYGYEKSQVTNAAYRRIEKSWKQRFDKLVKLSETDPGS